MIYALQLIRKKVRFVHKKVDICVVGAGPAGALLSLLLVKKGLSVVLVERTNTLAKAFRGEHLNEVGERILKHHDLFERVEELGLLRMETLEYCERGKVIKTITPDEQIGHLGIHVPQAHLLQAIFEQAEMHEKFDCLLNTTVKDLVADEHGHFTAVKAVQNGVDVHIEANMIIGADGRYSTVRKKAAIDTTVHSHGYDVLWAKIQAPSGWKPSIKMTLIDGMQISLFTQALGFIQIGWNIKKGSFPALRKQPFEPFIAKFITVFPELEGSVRASIRSWQDFMPLDVFSSTSEQWAKNGVVLIGDAVHTMTPTGAFGLNAALEDADILASLLDFEKIGHINFNICATTRKKEMAKLQAVQREKEQSFADHFVVYQ